RQMGSLSRLNPLLIAIAFIEALSNEKTPNISSFPGTLDPYAPRWEQVTKGEWSELAQIASRYSIPSHVWYRTPRVAYVRLISESALDRPFEINAEEGSAVEVITLVFRGTLGWRVFSFGSTSAEWIEFSPGTTQEPFRSYLDVEDES